MKPVKPLLACCYLFWLLFTVHAVHSAWSHTHVHTHMHTHYTKRALRWKITYIQIYRTRELHVQPQLVLHIHVPYDTVFNYRVIYFFFFSLRTAAAHCTETWACTSTHFKELTFNSKTYIYFSAVAWLNDFTTLAQCFFKTMKPQSAFLSHSAVIYMWLVLIIWNIGIVLSLLSVSTSKYTSCFWK